MMVMVALASVDHRASDATLHVAAFSGSSVICTHSEVERNRRPQGRLGDIVEPSMIIVMTNGSWVGTKYLLVESDDEQLDCRWGE